MHCVHGSAFSNIGCLTFVHYCLPFLVLFVTFNSKERKFAPTPNLNVLVLFEAIMLYFANVIICKDILLHIKLLLNFIMTTHMVSL